MNAKIKLFYDLLSSRANVIKFQIPGVNYDFVNALGNRGMAWISQDGRVNAWGFVFS